MREDTIIIKEIEHCGVQCKIKMGNYIVNNQCYGTYLLVEGNFLNKPIKVNFCRYASIDDFINNLKSVIMTHDLAGGVDDIIAYLDSFKNSVDPRFYSYDIF